MTPKACLLSVLLLTACGAMPAPRMPKMDIWPDGDAPDRLVMAAEARAQTRARNPDGTWAVADPVRDSDYEDDFPGSCTSDARGIACADHAPVQAPAGEATAPQTAGRVAIAFASLADDSRCTAEARQGRTRAEENLLVVRGFPGAGGAVPRARSLARMAGNGDAITWDQIADPRAFLALCHGMKG